jgi:dTDP-4-amino-4,6-dideoxygalactose transaminase
VFLSTPDTGSLEEAYVVDAMRSGWVAPAGPHLEAFERELAARCGRTHAVALSSGTAALHLALLELGVGPGSVVLVPTLTFIASANAVLYTGAVPIFVDCDPVTGNLDPQLLGAALDELESEGTTPAAVVTVDLLGKCVDYDPVVEICASYGVPLVEDAAEALGASDKGRAAGSFGTAAVLSFNGNKIMTTSGGGVLLTDDPRFADRVRYLSTQARQPFPHYEHTETGFNYRMSNVLAAIGRAQLLRLDEMVSRRRSMRERYAEHFASVPGVSIFQRQGDESDNCWLTALVVDPLDAGWEAGDLGKAFGSADIETRPLWKPMHQQPVFAGSRSFLTGASDRLFERGLTLPSGSALTAAEIGRIDDVISDFLADRT